MGEGFDERLSEVRQAYELSHEKNKEMIEDHLAHSAIIVTQQAAALAAGVLSRPGFFQEANN